MSRKTVLLAPVLFVVLTQSGFAALPARRDHLTSARQGEAVHLLEVWIESVVAYDRLPGMSIAIVHDQELVYAKGFGYMDSDHQVRASPGTIYSICSMSKLFTGIAVMQLRDAGRLNLDDPVAKYLPWFTPATIGTESPPPTLRDLLRHSSGLPCSADKTVWATPDRVYPTHEELVSRVSALKMSYDTNARFNSSNLGYALLGEVISAVSGMEYGDYVRQRILDPIGLEKTTTFVPGDLLGSELAVGYGRWPRRGPRVRIAISDLRSFTPAMGFASTVEDLAKFAMWQFRVLDGTDESVLSRKTLREMQTEEWSNPRWGLGFTIWQMGDRSIFGHQGGCPGYKSQILLWPDEKIAVAVLINATDAPQWTLATAAYEILGPALLEPGGKAEEPDRWADYTGFYSSDETWSDAEVFPWNGSLAVMWVPAPDPMRSLTMLRRIDKNVFREVDQSGQLGKHYIFGDDGSGRITGMRFNNNLLRKTVR